MHPAIVDPWGWITPGSLLFAVAYTVLRFVMAPKPKPNFLGRDTRTHFLDGIAIGPMALLVVSPFIDGLADALLKHDSAVLAAAGFVSVCAVMEPERKA